MEFILLILIDKGQFIFISGWGKQSVFFCNNTRWSKGFQNARFKITTYSNLIPNFVTFLDLIIVLVYKSTHVKVELKKYLQKNGPKFPQKIIQIAVLKGLKMLIDQILLILDDIFL